MVKELTPEQRMALVERLIREMPLSHRIQVLAVVVKHLPMEGSDYGNE